MTDIPQYLLGAKGSDFVNQRGEWDCYMISPFLPGYVQNIFAAIPPPFQDARLDSLIWYPSKDGEFDVKSAHTMIASLDFNNIDPLFKLIWKWPGLERIKTFFWLVANEALHTNFLCFNHHLSPSPECRHCNEGLHETILHTLRDCPILGEFWHILLPTT